MRSKYINWFGSHSNSTYLLTCHDEGPSKDSDDPEPTTESEAIEFTPDECEMQSEDDYPTLHSSADGERLRFAGEGCKRFFASYDTSSYNTSYRHLISLYSLSLITITESGSIGQIREGRFPTPCTGVCNVEWCSYQEIGQIPRLGSPHQLTNRRFSDWFNFNCDTEDTITPSLNDLEPMAMASSSNATVVLYESNDDESLYLTVIDN